MPRRSEGRRMLGRPRSSPRKLKRSRESKPNCSISRGSKKRYKWRKQSRNMRRRTRKARLRIFRREQCQLIWWIESSKEIRKFSPTWLNKKESKKQESGQCLFKKLNPWLRLRCLRLSVRVRERKNAGREELTKFASWVKISQESLQSTRDSFGRWVCDLKRPT